MRFLIPFASTLVCACAVAARPTLDLAIEPSQLAERRQQVREHLERSAGENAVLLLRAPPRDEFAGDVSYPYRPDNDLYYLSGMVQPGCALVLAVGDWQGLGKEVLYVTPTPERMRAWIGNGLSLDDAQRLSGIAAPAVVHFSALKTHLASLAPDTTGHHHRAHARPPEKLPFFFETAESFAAGKLPTEPYAYLVEALGSRAFHLELRAPGEIIHPLRQIKSTAEVARLRRAIDVTCEAQNRLLQEVRPGWFEYEARALIEATFVQKGCEGWGFPSIVGSGPNSCILHYEGDRRQLRAGDLLLADIGAQYGYYSADVTRTIPVSGKFTPRQRQLYEIVLEGQTAAIAAIKPGVNHRDVHRAAKEAMASRLRSLGILENEDDLDKFFPHGTSHGIGLNVHDPMPLKNLAAGMVITVEPGLYFPEEEIGIRIEDDVLVTEDGAEVLSTAAPKTIEAIEAAMQLAQERRSR